MVLTPFPGTPLYEMANKQGWIEDRNWANYDMTHAIMPTETLTLAEVQDELYKCYRSQFGSWRKRIQGIFSRNKYKRQTWRHMATQGVLKKLRGLV